jgi:menaquinone-dependent protoporphyrinogen IX oxidase
MSDILCIYYSRTGNTKRAMREIAQALDAELVEIRDDVSRRGWKGWLRCGVDAMRHTTAPLAPFETMKPLDEYDMVILGTPVWAGRCSSVIRGFLKEHGKELRHAAYVLLRGSEDKNEAVYEQMDLYTPCGHAAAVSLRRGSVGYAFWLEEFLRQTREFLYGQ